jgi:hypothetical protein
LVRSGAQARFIGRYAPDFGRWLTEEIDDIEAATPRARLIHAEKRLRRIIAEHASPFYRDRLLMMFAYAPGMEGTNLRFRAEAAAAAVDYKKWEGVGWHHYRYRLFPDEVRGLADQIYEHEVM